MFVLKCCIFDIFYRKIEPPFKPQVTSDTDTRYFDKEFTGESVELTPPDPTGPLGSIAEEPHFPQVSLFTPKLDILFRVMVSVTMNTFCQFQIRSLVIKIWPQL